MPSSLWLIDRGAPKRGWASETPGELKGKTTPILLDAPHELLIEGPWGGGDPVPNPSFLRVWRLSILQVLQDMGLPTGAEGRDSSKGEDSAEETEAKPAVVAPPPVVEAVSTPSATFPSDPTAEVSTW